MSIIPRICNYNRKPTSKYVTPNSFIFAIAFSKMKIWILN